MEVHRANNYNKVNKKKSAKILKKGKKIKIEGITYKVTNNKIGKGTVKVVSKDAGIKKIPKAIGLNYDYKYAYFTEMPYYSNDKKFIHDEQFFIVKK